jgi:hypothetical protein
MTTKSIFIGLHPNNLHYFRADYDGARWFTHPHVAPFRVIFNLVLPILAADDCPDITISSFRGVEMLDLAPDDFDFAEGAISEVFCPAGLPGAAQVWVPIAWHDPGRAPVVGSDKFVTKQLSDTVKGHFPRSRLEELSTAPDLCARRELWVRHAWLALDIAPESFQVPKLDLTAEENFELDRNRTTEAQRGERLKRVKAASTKSAETQKFNRESAAKYAAGEAAKRAKAKK